MTLTRDQVLVKNMINRELREDIFSTQELSLIAALIAWNFPIISIDTSQSKKVTFSFENTPELKKAIQAYWDETGTISPKKYFYALREAKSRIYGGIQ